MQHMTSKGLQAIEAERKSEEEWRQTVLTIAGSSLMSTTKSVSSCFLNLENEMCL